MAPSVVSTRRRLSGAVLVASVLVATMHVGTADAASVSCGETVTRNTRLTADIGPCPGDGIIIGADNITINLGGHRIFGQPGVGRGDAAGVRLPGRTGVRILGPGSITDFDAGVFINGGSGNRVQNLTVRDNIGPANTDALLGDGIVLFRSARNQILNNTVTHNGHFDGIGVLGPGSDSNNVQGNVVADTVGVVGDISLVGSGIIFNAFLTLDDPRRGESIYGNSAIGNQVLRNTTSGISNISNVNGQILRNTIVDNGPYRFGDLSGELQTNGIGVQSNQNATRDTRVLVEGNKVDHNGKFGIIVGSYGNTVRKNESFRNGTVGIAVGLSDETPTSLNQILENRTGGNGVFDLFDSDPCSAHWYGNVWGEPSTVVLEFGLSTAYYPDCTAVGGSGPKQQRQSQMNERQEELREILGQRQSVPQRRGPRE